MVLATCVYSISTVRGALRIMNVYFHYLITVFSLCNDEFELLIGLDLTSHRFHVCHYSKSYCCASIKDHFRPSRVQAPPRTVITMLQVHMIPLRLHISIAAPLRGWARTPAKDKSLNSSPVASWAKLYTCNRVHVRGLNTAHMTVKKETANAHVQQL